jgi:Flp pilus assembly pilin Flp
VTVPLRRGALGALLGRRGTTSAEYAILAVAIIVIVAGSIVLLGDPTNGAFIRVGGAILDGQAALLTPP